MSNENCSNNVPPKDFAPFNQRPNYNSNSQYKFITAYAQKRDVLDFLSTRREQGIIQEYAFILHDKDKLDEQTLAKEHFHIIVKFKFQKEDTAVKSMFAKCQFLQKDNNPAVFKDVQSLVDKGRAFDYLVHRNEPQKYQYDINEVTCSENARPMFDVKLNTDYDGENVPYQILQDLLSGISIIDIVKRYGKDFVYHYNNYKSIIIDLGASITLEAIAKRYED